MASTPLRALFFNTFLHFRQQIHNMIHYYYWTYSHIFHCFYSDQVPPTHRPSLFLFFILSCEKPFIL